MKTSDRRRLAGAALVSAALTVAACGGNGGSQGSSSSSAPSSAASSSSAAASSPPAEPAQATDQHALEIFDAIVKGDFASATANFDANMKQVLKPEALGDAWAKYQDQFGKYQSHGTPADVRLGDLTVVNVALQMEKTPGLYRVTFHPDGTVAGLWFLTADAPMPTP